MTDGDLTLKSFRPRLFWVRQVAIATAVLFVISCVFPVVAGLSKETAFFPKWWGMLDVGVAFVLAVMAIVVIAVGEPKVDRGTVDASYRIYRFLIHGILATLVVFFLAGDRITWVHCLTGLAWRAWLLLYGLPAWMEAVRATDAV